MCFVLFTKHYLLSFIHLKYSLCCHLGWPHYSPHPSYTTAYRCDRNNVKWVMYFLLMLNSMAMISEPFRFSQQWLWRLLAMPSPDITGSSKIFYAVCVYPSFKLLEHVCCFHKILCGCYATAGHPSDSLLTHNFYTSKATQINDKYTYQLKIILPWIVLHGKHA